MLIHSGSQAELRTIQTKAESLKLTLEVDGKKYQEVVSSSSRLWDYLNQVESHHHLTLLRRVVNDIWMQPCLTISNKPFLFDPSLCFQLSLKQIGFSSSSLVKVSFVQSKVHELTKQFSYSEITEMEATNRSTPSQSPSWTTPISTSSDTPLPVSVAVEEPPQPVYLIPFSSPSSIPLRGVLSGFFSRIYI